MILVTGATGFVGQALTKDLAQRGLAFRGASRAQGTDYVAVGEVTAGTDWSAALDGVDTVIHLAARTHVLNETAADPLAAYRAVNVDATLNLARQAARAGVRRFVFLSSVKVNGERTLPGHPFRESDPPRPEDGYGISKREAEDGLFALVGETGMAVTVLRPPLVYGPGVKANFASLVRLSTAGLPLPFGAVRNERSLVYVGNLTDAIIRVLDHPAAAGEVFLVADAKTPSIGALAKEIAAAAGKPARLISVPPFWISGALKFLGRGAMAERLLGSLTVDTGKIAGLLGWTPPYSLQDGLRATLGSKPPA
ncbi:SDR family oxidoreductase [Rhizobium sp. LjRoot30]|uniref:UDP-glucose 4-epimerase family protein n=1 Tax=Rhizobium sp. LjRoot30 TaxID=3342320 RepID=UPI003ECE6536